MDSSMCSGCLKEAIQVLFAEVPKPTPDKANFDAQNLLDTLGKYNLNPIKIPLKILRKLPFVLRENNFRIWVIVGRKENGWEILEIFSKYPKEVLGVAIDLGSTTISFYIYNFLEKKLIKKFSILNPQVKIGEDILTRLHFAKKEENLRYINEITINAINENLKFLNTSHIFYFSICGNTVISHFFARLPVNYLFIEPYTPVTNWYDLYKAKEFNLEAHPLANVFIFPSAGTFFGGDIIAGLYYSQIYKKEDGYYFYIDVGTNSEVVLGNKDFLLSCSGAAGPALEGGIFTCGVQAKEGAIKSVKIKNSHLVYETIGNESPIGICGSGIIDLIAELFIHGFLSPEGKFIVKDKERFKRIDDELVFIVAFSNETYTGKEIFIKESEIKNFLRSKGAMYTILTLLSQKIGIEFKDIKSFYIAGSFGNYININSAVTVGMLPEEALEKAIGLGNAAGLGALKFLKEANFEEIKEIINKITYLELSKDPDFMKIFTGAQFLPHVDLEKFPRIKKKIRNV